MIDAPWASSGSPRESVGGDLAEHPELWPVAKGIVSGRWVGQVRARYVSAGESFRVSGYELGLVAEDIRLQR